MAIECQCGVAAIVMLWSHKLTGLLPKVPLPPIPLLSFVSSPSLAVKAYYLYMLYGNIIETK